MSPPESASKERGLDAPPAWTALLGIGITVLVLGIVAVVLPILAALTAEIVLAWVALLVGVLQLAHAYHSRKERGVGWLVLSALLNVAVGGVLLIYPVQGVEALALLFGAFVLLIGITNVVLAFHLRPAAGWGWVLATGIVCVLAGVLLAMSWPQISFWLIGFYVGVSMISGGIARIVLALALRSRSLAKHAGEGREDARMEQARAARPASPG
jgi:uncharacterized membrane protein HdeD (DUF308 family)